MKNPLLLVLALFFGYLIYSNNQLAINIQKKDTLLVSNKQTISNQSVEIAGLHGQLVGIVSLDLRENYGFSDLFCTSDIKEITYIAAQNGATINKLQNIVEIHDQSCNYKD